MTAAQSIAIWIVMLMRREPSPRSLHPGSSFALPAERGAILSLGEDGNLTTGES